MRAATLGAVYIFFKRFGQEPFKLNKLSNEFCFINLFLTFFLLFQCFAQVFNSFLSGNHSSHHNLYKPSFFVFSFQRIHFLVSDRWLFGPNNNSWNSTILTNNAKGCISWLFKDRWTCACLVCWFHNMSSTIKLCFVMNFQIYYGRLLLDFDGTCHSLARVEIWHIFRLQRLCGLVRISCLCPPRSST